MRILKLKVKGLTLFKSDLEISFYAQKRVTHSNSSNLHHLFLNIYTLNTLLLFSGSDNLNKVIVLDVISFVIHMLNSEPINNIDSKYILNKSKEVLFEVYFTESDKKNDVVVKLIIVIKENKYYSDKYIISMINLYYKDANKVKTRKNLCMFKGTETYSLDTEKGYFLTIPNYKNLEFRNIVVKDMLSNNINNTIKNYENFVLGFSPLLDYNIEYITKWSRGIKLKFRGKEELILKDVSELNKYITSKVIKGLNVLANAVAVFKQGGYLIINNIDYYLDKEIVNILLCLFATRYINRNGATLVFSTQDTELLHNFSREGTAYVVQSNTLKELAYISKCLDSSRGNESKNI